MRGCAWSRLAAKGEEEERKRREEEEVLWWYRLRPFKKEVLRCVVEQLIDPGPLSRAERHEARQAARHTTGGPGHCSHHSHHSSIRHPELPDLHFSHQRKTRRSRKGGAAELTLWVADAYPKQIRDMLQAAFHDHEHGVRVVHGPKPPPDAVAVLYLYDHMEELEHTEEESYDAFFHHPELVLLARWLVAEQADGFSALSEVPRRGSSTTGGVTRGRGSISQLISAASTNAVMVYSGRQAFGAYREQGESWRRTSRASADGQVVSERDAAAFVKALFTPLWSQWPRDRRLQHVAAEMEVRKLTKARLQGRLQFARPEKLEEMRAGKTRSKRSRGKRGNTAPKEAPVPEELPRPSSGEADDAPKRGRSRRRRSSIFRMRREIKETATSDDDLHGLVELRLREGLQQVNGVIDLVDLLSIYEPDRLLISLAALHHRFSPSPTPSPRRRCPSSGLFLR